MAGIAQRAWSVAIGVAAFFALCAATRSGIGVSTDSVAYIAEARQLLDGHGYSLPAGLLEIYADADPARDPVPTTHFPPLYPVVIALTGLAGAGASSFRWLNGLVLPVTVLTVAVMVERFTGSRWIAAAAAGMVVLSPAVLRTHAMAWSEPLFIALGFLGLLAVARFIEEPRWWLLVTGALALGLAMVTRYAGIAFVLTGLVGLVLRRRHLGLRPAALLLSLSLLPMALYAAVMAVSGATGSGFTVELGAPSALELEAGRHALQDWFQPAFRLPAVLVVLWLSLVAIGVLRFFVRVRLPELPLLLLAFLVTYAAVILGSQSAFDQYLPIEERFLVPPYVAVVVLVACVVGRRRSGLGWWRQPLLVAVTLFVAATAVAGAELLKTGVPGYPGFEARFWRESEAMQQIRALPPTARIYSNFPDAIYVRTGREARLLPRERFPSGRIRTHPAARTNRMVSDVHSGHGVVVFFISARRDLLPGPDELASILGVEPRTYLADALVFEAGP